MNEIDKYYEICRMCILSILFYVMNLPRVMLKSFFRFEKVDIQTVYLIDLTFK